MLEALMILSIYFMIVGIIIVIGIGVLLLSDLIFKTHIGRRVARLFIN